YGTQTYYRKRDDTAGALWKVPAGGGEETRVADTADVQTFAVTRGGIYFVTGRELRYLSLATGKSKSILTIGKPMSNGLSVSPDERWLLYSQLDQTGSDLMLVENFR